MASIVRRLRSQNRKKQPAVRQKKSKSSFNCLCGSTVDHDDASERPDDKRDVDDDADMGKVESKQAVSAEVMNVVEFGKEPRDKKLITQRAVTSINSEDEGVFGIVEKGRDEEVKINGEAEEKAEVKDSKGGVTESEGDSPKKAASEIEIEKQKIEKQESCDTEEDTTEKTEDSQEETDDSLDALENGVASEEPKKPKSKHPFKKMQSKIMDVMSHQNFDSMSPEVCIDFLRSPSLKLLSALNRKLKQNDAEWKESFLDQSGSEALLDLVDTLGIKRVTQLADALLLLECVSCVKSIMNSKMGLAYLVEHGASLNRLVKGKLHLKAISVIAYFHFHC